MGIKFKGSSIMPYVFVILLLFIVAISWRSLGGGFGDAQSRQMSDAKALGLLKSEIESAKRYSKQSLSFAFGQATHEHALGGGIHSGGNINSWICNSPSPPIFSEVKSCLEENTLRYANLPLEGYSVSQMIEYNLEPFTSVSYEIDEAGALGGQYDEGDYMLTMKGGSIEVSAKQGKASEGMELTELAGKNRFWYLYRNFYAWSNENLFSEKSLECASLCLGCECINMAAEIALEGLKEKFDEQVHCSFERVCCSRGPSRITGLLNGAEFWDQSECISGCGLSCSQGGPGEIDKSPFLRISQGYSRDGISDNKLAAVYEFSCSDSKYFVSGGEGPQALVFTVRASVSYADLGAC